MNKTLLVVFIVDWNCQRYYYCAIESQRDGYPVETNTNDPILDAAKEQLRAAFTSVWDKSLKAVADAYRRGRADGKADAEAEMRNRLAGVLGVTIQTVSVPAPLPPPPTPELPQEPENKNIEKGKRAPRGTVRPAVISALESLTEGARPAHLAIITGINENSIRGMLNSLAAETPPITEKRGDLWYLAAQK